MTDSHAKSERKTRLVVYLAASVMVAEIVVGMFANSLALLADGWHMASHVGAIGLASLAYWFARRHADNPRFNSGTKKILDLAGYTSAVALALVAVIMGYEAIIRLLDPKVIAYSVAIPVAIVGLVVNLLSAIILGHGHDHDHESEHGHHDHNLRAAYLHVLADTLTSAFAIIALLGSWYYGVIWLDPALGIVGGLVILNWAFGLGRSASLSLLDYQP